MKLKKKEVWYFSLINMHINMALVRPETSPCLTLEDKYTGWRSSCIAYWWASLDRMTAQSETRNPLQNEAGREAVTVVAVVVWFSIFTLSLNKTGLALCPNVSQRGAGCKGRKERRERKGKREKSSQSYLSYSQESMKGRQTDIERNGGGDNREGGREDALPLET